MKFHEFEDKLETLIKEALGLGVEEGQFTRESVIEWLERIAAELKSGEFDAH